MNVLVNTAVSTDATTLMVALSASVKLGLNLTAPDTDAKVRKMRVYTICIHSCNLSPRRDYKGTTIL